MNMIKCSRCGATAERIEVRPGVVTDPDGWAVITASVRPVVVKTLCPPCTKIVLHVLTHDDGSSLLGGGILADTYTHEDAADDGIEQ
jgi:hypothetical protein